MQQYTLRSMKVDEMTDANNLMMVITREARMHLMATFGWRLNQMNSNISYLRLDL